MMAELEVEEGADETLNLGGLGGGLSMVEWKIHYFDNCGTRMDDCYRGISLVHARK